MLNINRAQVLGNLTRDPEMRYTPNGQAVTNFTVATNRRWKGVDGGEGGEATEYHDVVVWGKQAENVTPMLKKGEPVFVEGRLQTRSWEGQDGAKRYKTEIVAESVIVLGSKSGMQAGHSTNSNPIDDIAGERKNAKKAPEQKPSNDEEIDIEDIPF